MSASTTPMLPGWSGQDRRVHRRVSLSAPATLLVNDTSRPATCVSLSLGGAGLRADAPVGAGTPLKLHLELDTGERVRALAEVVRSDGIDIAVRFVRLDPTSMVAILSRVQ